MNPIMQAMLAQLKAGKQISRITVDNRRQPSKVIFEIADGTATEVPIQHDYQTFMDWWKDTGNYIRLMALIKPLEELK